MPVFQDLLKSLALKPAMKPTDIKILATELSRATNYVEYGSGGSSNMAVAVGVKCVAMLESAQKWLEKEKV